MINPPDDLLEDLQSALPPEQQAYSPLQGVTSSGRSSSRSNGRPVDVNGFTSPPHDHLYDRTEHPGVDVRLQQERESMASTVSQKQSMVCVLVASGLESMCLYIRIYLSLV